jgi:hypothetical protein
MSLNVSLKIGLSLTVSSTGDQSSTSIRKTLQDFDKLISSLEEVSGRSPRVWRGGPTIESSGPAPAPAKGKASRAKDSAPMIQGICGRTFIGSSVPPGPLSLWESKLRLRLARIGSTESALIWKTKTTPSGRLISRLAPSTRHTNGSGSFGSRWPMACAQPDNKTPEAHLAMKKRMGERDGTGANRTAITDLQVMMKAYSPSYNPTPTVADVQGGRKTRSGARSGEPLLNGLLAAYSATPRASDGEKGGPNQKFGAGGTPLPTQIYAMARSGRTPNGSSAQSTEKRGAPNPEFAFWLMGFPDVWTSGALAAMRSLPRSPRRSSKR